jgi:acyl carrier protein
MKRLNDYQKQQVRETLADKLGFDLEEIQDDSNLKNDLGTDSLDDIELIMEFEKMFNCSIPDSLAENVDTVSDIYDCLANCI